MKTKLTTLSLITAVLLSGGTAFAQTDVSQDAKVYQVEKRLDNYTRPVTFTPTKAIPVNGAIISKMIFVNPQGALTS